jgi:hypothetical protein
MSNRLALIIGEAFDPVIANLRLALFMRNPTVRNATSFSEPLHAELQADSITHVILYGLAYTPNDAAKYPYRVCVLNAKVDEAIAAGIYTAESIPEVLAWASH